MVTRLGLLSLPLAFGALLVGCADSDDAKDCANKARLHAGSIEITGMEGSARLEDLECIQVVTGNLTISDPAVGSLGPLGSLVQVLGDVTLEGASLSSLHGLEQLEEIRGELRVAALARLESLTGLEGLKKLDGALRISNLPKLASIEALGALDAIGGDLSLDRLPSLVTFAGLGALVHVDGDLVISDNAGLTDLDVFRALRTIDGTFRLSNNPALSSASFRNRDPSLLPAVGNGIIIFQNASLKTLSAFGVPANGSFPCDAANLADGISVGHNDSLEALELPPVQNRNVNVFDNERLAAVSDSEHFGAACSFQLASLPSLTSVDLHEWSIDSLRIWSTGLVTLDGFATTVVNCSLDVGQNAALADASALSSEGSIAHDFSISDNPSLPTCQARAVLDALPAMTSQCLVNGRVATSARSVSIARNNDAAVCE